MTIINRLLLLIVLIPTAFFVEAAIDIHQFDTESQRARYHQLVDELRCPKCQNQNLAGSNSQIATDLRRELHRLLLEGKTDTEIKDFMVARYGDFVLYKPRLQSSTVMLWALPIVLLLGGSILLLTILRKRRRVPASSSQETLNEKDRTTLNQLLDGDNK